MDRLIAILILAIGWSGNAATYYVTTNGNNSANGSLATPWSNVWYAASAASGVAAGDTVNVGPGTFNEFVTNAVSGSAGSLITFNGTRGAGGEWLTIIDPSTAVTSWTAATEIGDGVYRSTTPFAARSLTISNQTVMGPNTTNTVSSGSAYSSGAPATGAGWLLLATDAQVTPHGTEVAVAFWDSFGALWTANGTTLYLRLRDGSDPTGLPIAIAPNGNTAGEQTVYRPALRINGQSYVTWQNVKVQGAFACLLLSGAAHHNIIQSNYLQNGFSRIYLSGSSSNNIILGNEITANYYGTTNLGAWDAGATALYGGRDSTYEFSKYVFSSVNSSHDKAVYFTDPGNSNVFCWNHLFSNFGEGLSAWGETVTPHGTLIFSNTIEHCSSVGITLTQNGADTEVHGNYLSDCNSQIRLHHMDTANRRAYIYRNRFWLPTGVGNHIFFHWSDTQSYYPTNWIYNNSFSGGKSGFELSTYYISNVHFLNNLFSMTPFVYASTTFKNDTNYMGEFDYNWHRPLSPEPAWVAAHNVSSTTNSWTNVEGMSFALPADSQAIGAALDLPTTYPALPQDGTTKSGANWDIGALEAGNEGGATSTNTVIFNGKATLGAGVRIN